MAKRKRRTDDAIVVDQGTPPPMEEFPSVAPIEDEFPMPGPTHRPCPSCGQPMTQKIKQGRNRYYYCRGFGSVPACRYPGVKVDPEKYHKLATRLETGVDHWEWIESENRYQLVCGEE